MSDTVRIIDPHVHIYKNDPPLPWAPETTDPPKEDAAAETLLDLMAANGVERTVLVQPSLYRWDTSYTAAARQKCPDEFMGVCCVNPEDPEAPDHLSRGGRASAAVLRLVVMSAAGTAGRPRGWSSHASRKAVTCPLHLRTHLTSLATVASAALGLGHPAGHHQPS